MVTFNSQGDPDGSPLEAAETIARDLGLLAAQLSAGTARLIKAIRAFDRMSGFVYLGTSSTAHFLNWQCGMGLRTAREHVRVARALDALPQLAEAFDKGQVSYSKVRAITRIATPQDEDYFLNIAHAGSATHVERLVRLYRKHGGLEEERRQSAKQLDQRSFECHWDEDGSLVFKGKLSAELGGLLLRALEAARDAHREQAASDESDGPAGPSDSSETPAPPEPAPSEDCARMRRADALAALAESYLANGPAALSGGERYQLYVHVDEAALTEPEASKRCELEDQTAIPIPAARRIACDCSRVCVHENEDGTVLDIGRRTRQIPSAIIRALRIRDGGCHLP